MPAPTITLDESAQENGLAIMLRDLISQNLVQRPEKLRAFNSLSGPVAITASDADVRLTLHFDRGRCVIRDGLAARPTLHILGDAETILSIANLPLRVGLVDLLKPGGRALGRCLLTGRLKIRGLLLHLITAVKLTQVISVN